MRIRKGLFGRYLVGYECPRCLTALTSPLDDAGKQDACPDCGTQFVVPGTKERAELNRNRTTQLGTIRPVWRNSFTIFSALAVALLLSLFIVLQLTNQSDPEAAEQTTESESAARPDVEVPPGPSTRPSKLPSANKAQQSANKPARKDAPEGEPLTFVILDEEKYDSAIKTQVVYSVLASGTLTISNLKDLLERLYRRAIQTPGFRNHFGAVTHVFIYVYTSKEHFQSGGGQWVAMLSKVGKDREKLVDVREEFLQQLKLPPETRHGLSENERKEIFKRLVSAEDETLHRAEAEYPMDPTQSLSVGDTFQLTKDTPLVADPEPTDPLMSLKQMRTIPARAYIRIEKVYQSKRSIATHWYAVDCLNQQKQYLGSGWVNSMALMGQGNIDIKRQLELQSIREEELREERKSAISQELNISRELLDELEKEGLEKNWPLPAMDNE
jgi:hypothetical protein